MEAKKYNTFKEFYPFYLSQHQNKICILLHYIGLWLVLISSIYFIYQGNYRWLLLCPTFGYGFAWIGHIFFEKNIPATFKFFRYSLIGDWRMFFDITIGKIKFY